MNQREFAALCDCSVQALANWELEGMPPPERPAPKVAYYDIQVHIPWVRINKWTVGADDRALKLKAERELTEMERDLQQGKLMLVADAEKVWGQILSGIRARLLSIPPKVGALLGANLSVAQRSEIIRRELYEALDTLSNPAVEVEEPEPEERPSIRRKPGRPKSKK